MRNDYLRRVFLSMRAPTLKTLAIGAVRQSGRLLLAFVIGWVVLASTQFWPECLSMRPYFMIEPMLLLSGGFAFLFIELLGVMARGFVGLPYRDAETTGVGIAARAFVAPCLLFSVAGASWGLAGGVLQGGIALVLLAWNLPSTLRSVRDLGLGLRSLPTRCAAVTPGALSARGPARLGRQIVVGQRHSETLGVEAEGATARVAPEDAAWLSDLDRRFDHGPERPRVGAIAIIAEATSDGDGYRGSGVRLTAGGLPMWILDAHDAAPCVRAYARRLGLARFVDRVVVGCAILIASGLTGISLSIWTR
jgi:hypothetical protein